jgi:tetratricopeptide (TPR) repeat protein
MHDTIVQIQDLKSAINAQDFLSALAIADRLMEENPDDTVALIRARVLISLGRKLDAFDELDDILATSNDSKILQQAASRFYIVARDEGLIAEALTRQQTRLNDEPDDAAALTVMAQLYAYAGDKNNELLIREQLQAQQGSESNLGRIAELQRELGRIEEASESVVALAASTDTHTAAHLLLRQAREENSAGRADLAAETATRALAMGDISPFMTMQFARELEAAGDTTTALTALDTLAATAENPEIRDRASLEICRIQLKQGQLSREVSTQLTRLQQSEIAYVQEQAAQLLNQAQ